MEALDATAYFDDDLLDFSSDVGEEDDKPKDPSSSSTHFKPTEDCVEEELEWLLNKDAFPSVDTFVDIMSIGGPNYCSPVSVLENSSSSSTKMSYCRGSGSGSSIGIGGSNFSIPVRRPRTKRRRRGGLAELPSKHWWSINITESKASSGSNSSSSSIGIGRKCQHCQAEKTPQWRAGPMGPKTLCNACGVRYKSGRLVPEYRPANSPTFSSELHSNSHRKVVEMRKGKQEEFLSECNSDSQRKIVEMRKGKQEEFLSECNSDSQRKIVEMRKGNQEEFLSECNSNSQRKVVEMRKGKQQENMMVNASCG